MPPVKVLHPIKVEGRILAPDPDAIPDIEAGLARRFKAVGRVEILETPLTREAEPGRPGVPLAHLAEDD